MTFADYLALRGVNWSSLKHLWAGSPLHYQHHRQAEDRDTTGRMAGRMLHALVLGTFDEDFVIYDGGDRRGNAWKEFQAANPGKTIMKPGEVADVRAQAAAVLAHPVARGLIIEGRTEVTIEWVDADTGLPCKGRLDAFGLAAERLADLKGCGSLDQIERTCHRQGYVHQLAWYQRGVRAVYGVDVSAYLIGVETKAPHDVGVWRADRDLLAMADRDLTATMARLADCIHADRWPGRMPDLGELLIPTWMLSDELGDSIPDEGLEMFSDL